MNIDHSIFVLSLNAVEYSNTTVFYEMEGEDLCGLACNAL
jgi:hypothetical protein